MPGIPAELLVHEIEIAPFIGQGATGPHHGPYEPTAAFVDEHRRIVRAPDGRTVTSGTTAYVDLDTEIGPEALVRVRGRAARVVEIRHRDGGGLPTPDHIEIILE